MSSNSCWPSAVPPFTRGELDDTHEIYDQPTITNPSPHRHQQQQSTLQSAHRLSVPPRPSSASGSLRHLRRRASPRVENPQSATHRRTISVDAAPQPRRNRSSTRATATPRGAGVSFAEIAPALSEAETEAGASTSQDSVHQLGESYWPQRSTRVSPRTASAILWALEEAIRKPFPFTPDFEELNASMSELTGASGPVATGGSVRPQNGGSRSNQGTRPVHTVVPAGVRTPTDIMRDRRDREARKLAEKEARERQQERELRQQQAEERQQFQSQQHAAAGATGRSDFTAQQHQGPVRQPAVVDPAYIEQASESLQQPVPTGGRRQEPSQPPGNGTTAQRQPAGRSQSRPGPSSSQQQQPAPQPRQQPPSQSNTQQGVGTSQPQSTQVSAPGSQSQEQSRRSTFPHAFERWETLSSHWEGLTGYWIRKMEQSNSELSQDPLNQQMARQINDLSAAGANLFHAVVELQRLRASSERKFQRWFFDTRAEQEKAREVQAELERQLQALKLERSDAGELRQKADAERKKAEDLVKEMRRELQISKEEARRAWEELGRREQEERDRTASLRNGEPTHVGGVQVVPMITGIPSRQNSSANRPPTREGPYPGGPGPTSMGGQPRENTQYVEEEELPETDPFTETPRTAQTHAYPPSSHPPGSSATIVGGTPKSQPPATSVGYGETPGHFYQHGGTILHGEPEVDQRSYVASTEGSELEEEYAAQHGAEYHHDVQSHEYAGSEGEYDDDSQQEYPPTTSGAPIPYGQTSVDYSGSSWGGWDSITPRHRHPTRLSDVLEEDERSRTSPSRASQASRGMH
ncbi:hypothetical protein BGW36DRAFT_400985 [Talaromyces proteolyticus]|uniref:Uncharacterized protein n=1 Tax=Talaromyces proteolyticus TaxID=1131652 RepID=A0AAD4PVB7_9EURO|nr:uncharacterized protein BGW36DRAFT_400985 [Talaromyces proteolyticus]KAH8690548.1 hypothetical protein BGW36DRAFT_400985 [Talaromyces proteolyticus]